MSKLFCCHFFTLCVLLTPVPPSPYTHTHTPNLSTPIPQGAPESVMERCQYLRVGTGKVALTMPLKEQLTSLIRDWGTGRDTLRCLGMATRDSPPKQQDMDLENSTKFAEYEVSQR